MREIRVVVGAVLLIAVAAGVVAGVWVLRQAGGGGLPVTVTFADDQGLSIDDDVIYGDQIVGRVDDITEDNGEVRIDARIAADHANLLREGSRFWIEETLSGAVLIFDTPLAAGRKATPGARFDGLEVRPEPDPDVAPLQAPRNLDDPPDWLCEVRVTLDLDDGTEFGVTQRRKVTGAVVETFDNGELLVLAPSWVAQYSGDLLDETFRIELSGGTNLVAEPLNIRLPFIVLLAREADYAGGAAPLWPEPVADDQALILTDFEGRALTGVHEEGGVEVVAEVGQGLLAMIDGTKVAGFAIPPVGKSFGVTWVPLNGAGIALDEAREKRR